MNPLGRAVKFGLYDRTREMPIGKRVITWIGILLQGFAIYAAITRSLVWPLKWPTGLPLYISIAVLYLLGGWLLNAMLTSEFIRKTRMESEQVAAQAIQKTLQPDPSEVLPGYEIEVCARPFRNVGGDYIDVVTLPERRALLAIADVSGKGMAAALLSANVQALVRGLGSIDADPLQLTLRINDHLARYTPDDRFVTAVVIVLESRHRRSDLCQRGPQRPGRGGKWQPGETGSHGRSVGDVPAGGLRSAIGPDSAGRCFAPVHRRPHRLDSRRRPGEAAVRCARESLPAHDRRHPGADQLVTDSRRSDDAAGQAGRTRVGLRWSSAPAPGWVTVSGTPGPSDHGPAQLGAAVLTRRAAAWARMV